MPLCTPGTEVVSDEFGKVEGVVSFPTIHFVDGEVASLNGYSVTTVNIVFKYVVFVSDLKADVFGQLVYRVVAICQRIEIKSGGFNRNDLSGILQIIQKRKFKLIVKAGQSLHIGAIVHAV